MSRLTVADRVMAYLVFNPHSTVEQIVKGTDIKTALVMRAVRKLKEDGRIEVRKK